MANLITYEDKIDLVSDTTTPDKYKWNAADANQVKSAVNSLSNAKTTTFVPGGNWNGTIFISQMGDMVIMRVLLVAKTLIDGDMVITNALPIAVNTAYATCVHTSGSTVFGVGRMSCGDKIIRYVSADKRAPVELYCTFVTTLKQE